MTPNPALDFLASRPIVICERKSARITRDYCEKRRKWDESCRGCQEAVGTATGKKPAKLNFTRVLPKKECKKATNSARVYVKKYKCQPATRKFHHRRLGLCAKCGVKTNIYGRGLGQNCYRRESENGTLEINFPAKPQGGQRVEK